MYPRKEKDSWHFTPRGQIYFPFTRYYEHHEYCFDMIYGDPNYTEDMHAFVCREGPRMVGESAKRCAELVFPINFENRQIDFFLYTCMQNPCLRTVYR